MKPLFKQAWKGTAGLFEQFINLVASPNQTYYPDSPRKSRFTILRENIQWILQNRELNRYYFIYGLDRKSGRSEDVIGYRRFTKIRDSRNLKPEGVNFNYAALLRDKFVFGQFLNSLNIPTPDNLALIENGQVTNLKTMQVSNLGEFLETQSELDGFCKKLTGLQGKGAFRLTISKKGMRAGNDEICCNELSAMCKGTYLLQKRIVQHPELNRLYPHALNTMRIVTFNNAGNIEVFNGAMRIGTGSRNVDNWGIGGIAVGIDIESGTLRKKGYYKPKYGRLVEVHPDTNVVFKNFEIPFFKRSIELVCNLHRFLYGVHSIGWDVAVGPDGPIIIEGNEDWDGSFAMAEEADFKMRFFRMFENQN